VIVSSGKKIISDKFVISIDKLKSFEIVVQTCGDI